MLRKRATILFVGVAVAAIFIVWVNQPEAVSAEAARTSAIGEFHRRTGALCGQGADVTIAIGMTDEIADATAQGTWAGSGPESGLFVGSIEDLRASLTAGEVLAESQDMRWVMHKNKGIDELLGLITRVTAKGTKYLRVVETVRATACPAGALP